MYNESKIIIYKNKIDIINYLDIIHFDDSKIIIKTKKELLNIIGTNLVISRLITDEVLITGTIKSIEFR